MASFGDILNAIGSSLKDGATYGMQQMGAAPAPYVQSQQPQQPQMPQQQQMQPLQQQDNYQGAPGLSHLNLLQYLTQMGQPYNPRLQAVFQPNFLGRLGQ
jgi:hypothetical protein